MRDYTGLERGKLKFGERGDGMIIQASSTPARHLAAKLKERNINGRATRLDFQTTGKAENGAGNYCNGVQQAYQNGAGKRRGRAALKTAAYSVGGVSCGMAIASRKSERHFRVYNKTLEQRNKIEADLVRFEGEYKGGRARQAWNMYKSAATPFYLSCSLMHAEFSAFGIDMSWLVNCERCEFPSAYEPTSDEKSLSWLRSHVRSTVFRLKTHGKTDEVLEALGLDSNTLN
jgi:DNA relaxase NicK